MVTVVPSPRELCIAKFPPNELIYFFVIKRPRKNIFLGKKSIKCKKIVKKSKQIYSVFKYWFIDFYMRKYYNKLNLDKLK